MDVTQGAEIKYREITKKEEVNEELGFSCFNQNLQIVNAGEKSLVAMKNGEVTFAIKQCEPPAKKAATPAFKAATPD